MPLAAWSVGTTVLLVGAATWTDLRTRRIPNRLTFPAIGLGLAAHAATGGWEGLLISVSGAVVAPCLLALLHAGKGFGMGDIKLVAAIGAVLGPHTAAIAVLVSALAGGLLAAARMLKAARPVLVPWLTPSHRTLDPARESRPREPFGTMTIPYGVAIAIGTLISLAATWFTGSETWLF